MQKILRSLMVDGCYESVLDEHFWMRLPTIKGGRVKLAEDLAETFRLSVESSTFRELERNGRQADKGIRIRCHAAVPFGGTDHKGYAKLTANNPSGNPSEGNTEPLDDLRAAFNTPFWPHVLASTSVGQKGLDFNTWCS